MVSDTFTKWKMMTAIVAYCNLVDTCRTELMFEPGNKLAMFVTLMEAYSFGQLFTNVQSCFALVNSFHGTE